MTLAAIERDDHSAPFFDAAAEGRLLLKWSPSSGEWSEPAAVVCSVSQAADLEWREAVGTGVLVSWTVKPGRAADEHPAVDTVIGVVELAEGPWLALQLRSADSATLQVGIPVTVVFERPEGSEFLPVARLPHV